MTNAGHAINAGIAKNASHTGHIIHDLGQSIHLIQDEKNIMHIIQCQFRKVTHILQYTWVLTVNLVTKLFKLRNSIKPYFAYLLSQSLESWEIGISVVAAIWFLPFLFRQPLTRLPRLMKAF